MSDKNLVNNDVGSDDDDEDDDYCPIKTANEQSEGSDESEPDDGEDDDAIGEASVGQKREVDVRNSADSNVKPYDESKTNELWKTFMSSSNSSTTKKDLPKTTPVMITENSKAQESKPVVVTNKTFQFAGEKVTVSNTDNAAAAVAVSSKESQVLKRPASSSVSVFDRLGIGKKQKLSTLEKSRLDWSVHKDSESLNEDLESHRRSKDSFVERKAFLQRTEFREHDHYLSNVKKR